MIGNSKDETNFPHKLFLIHIEVLRIRKAFADGFPANINFQKKNWLSKMMQTGGVIRDITIFGNILSSVAKKEQIQKRNY